MRVILVLLFCLLSAVPSKAAEPMSEREAHELALQTFDSIEQMAVYIDGDMNSLNGDELAIAMYRTTSALNSMVGKFREKWGLDQLRAVKQSPSRKSALDHYSNCALAGSMLAEVALLLATLQIQDASIHNSFQQYRGACAASLRFVDTN